MLCWGAHNLLTMAANVIPKRRWAPVATAVERAARSKDDPDTTLWALNCLRCDPEMEAMHSVDLAVRAVQLQHGRQALAALATITNKSLPPACTMLQATILIEFALEHRRTSVTKYLVMFLNRALARPECRAGVAAACALHAVALVDAINEITFSGPGVAAVFVAAEMVRAATGVPNPEPRRMHVLLELIRNFRSNHHKDAKALLLADVRAVLALPGPYLDDTPAQEVFQALMAL